MRSLAVVLLLGSAGLQRPADPPAVRVPDAIVRVDAAVTDARGRFVDTLTAADFALSEDGVAQTIDAVRVVKAAREAAAPPADGPGRTADDEGAVEQAEAAEPGARLFGVYLDEYHVSPAGAERVRPALAAFVNGLGPRDLLVVMKPLDSILSIRLSRDRRAALAAIESFTGRQGDYEPRNAYERTYMPNTPAAIEQARMQVTLSALQAMAIHLGWVAADARKTLVAVTGELARGMRRRGLSLPTIDSIAQAANHFNVSIYPIDPMGAGTGDGGAAPNGADTLGVLAADTDGRASRTAGDLMPAVRRIEDDARAYYLITFHSTRKIDGRFHTIDLRVKRPALRVRTRRGYWGTSPDELMRAELAAREAMPRKPPEPPRHLSPFIRPWFGYARAADGRTRVTFVWEPVRSFGDRGRRLPARVELTALGDDDSTVFEGAVMPTSAGAVDDDEGRPVRAVFEAPPGALRLRMSIEDSASRVIDHDVREISLRDLKGPVVMSTPEVFRTRNAREFRALAADAAAAPVASREFSRTERLLIRVRAYAASGARPAISATLENRLGQTMRDLTVTPATTADRPDQIDLPLAPFASGEYHLALKAHAPDGETRDVVTFRITS